VDPDDGQPTRAHLAQYVFYSSLFGSRGEPGGFHPILIGSENDYHCAAGLDVTANGRRSRVVLEAQSVNCLLNEGHVAALAGSSDEDGRLRDRGRRGVCACGR
jgi:hypothetical protein